VLSTARFCRTLNERQLILGSGLVVQVVSALLRGSWQDFNWHDASRGPSAIAELLVVFKLLSRHRRRGSTSTSCVARVSQQQVMSRANCVVNTQPKLPRYIRSSAILSRTSYTVRTTCQKRECGTFAPRISSASPEIRSRKSSPALKPTR